MPVIKIEKAYIVVYIFKKTLCNDIPNNVVHIMTEC